MSAAVPSQPPPRRQRTPDEGAAIIFACACLDKGLPESEEHLNRIKWLLERIADQHGAAAVWNLVHAASREFRDLTPLDVTDIPDDLAGDPW